MKLSTGRILLASLAVGAVIMAADAGQDTSIKPANRVELLPDWTTGNILIRVHGAQYAAGVKLWLKHRGKWVSKVPVAISEDGGSITVSLAPAELQGFVQEYGRSMPVWTTQPQRKTEKLEMAVPGVDLLPTVAMNKTDEGVEFTLTAKNLLPGYQLYVGGYDANSGRLVPRRVLNDKEAVIRLLGVNRSDDNLNEIRFLVAKNTRIGKTLQPEAPVVDEPAGPQPGAKPQKGGIEELFPKTNEDNKKPGGISDLFPNKKKGDKPKGGLDEIFPKKQNKQKPGEGLGGLFPKKPKDQGPPKDAVKKGKPKVKVVWTAYVQGVDGSQSRVIELPVDGPAEQNVDDIGEAVAAPAGGDVKVPNVTGMFLPDAAAALKEAGLVAAPVESVSLRPVVFDATDVKWQSAFVLGQGVAAGEKAQQGEQIQLAVSIESAGPSDQGAPPDGKPGGIDNRPPDNVSPDAGPPPGPDGDLLPDDQGPPPDQPDIDIGDDGGLIDTDPSLGDLGGGCPPDGGGLGGGMPDGGLDPSFPPDNTIPPGNGGMPPNNNGGINTDPTANSLSKQIAGLILKIVAGSLANSKNPPPKAVTDLLAGIGDLLAKSGNAGAGNIAPYLNLTATNLGVNLTAADRQNAQADWQRLLQRRGDALRRADGKRRSRFILLWVMRWLNRNGKNPTGNMGFTKTGGGKLDIVSTSPGTTPKPGDLPERIKQLLASLSGNRPGSSPSGGGLSPGANTTKPGSTKPGKKAPPSGPRLVREGDGPDLVLVPDVTNVTLKVAMAKLKKNDLKTIWKGKVFLEDLVFKQDPPKGWQKAVNGVTVGTGVPVPDVTKISLAQAMRKLKGWDLKAGYPKGKAFNEDKVIGQDPPAHTAEKPSTLPHGAYVKLNLGVPVPKVTGMTLAAAINRLKGWDLRAGFDPKHAFNEDAVVAQDPQPGTFAGHGDKVALDIRVKVPNLRGKSLSGALKSLKGWDLRANYHKNAFNEDTVTAQDPPAGKLVRHTEPIDLTVAVKAPNLYGQTVAEAFKRLRGWDLQGDVPNRFAKTGDIVRAQTPAAGTLVAHGSKVSMTRVVARVPNVVGLSMKEAYRRLHDDGAFAVNYSNDLVGGDEVTTQNPAAGSELPRGENVALDSLWRVPNLLGATASNAAATLRNARGDFRFSFSEQNTRNSDEVTFQSIRGGALVRPRKTIQLTALPRVPNVVGSSRRQAEQILNSRGLGMQVVSSSTQETLNESYIGRTQVATQSPGAGRHQSRRFAVRVTMVTYIRGKVTVPSVAGLNPRSAASRLSSAGLRLRIFLEDRSGEFRFSDLSSDLIYTAHSQNPTAGSRVYKGTSVRVLFTYRRRVTYTTVPNVRNLTYAQARSRLAAAGLRVGRTIGSATVVRNGRRVANRFASSSPSAGTRVRRGSSVNLNYFKFR